MNFFFSMCSSNEDEPELEFNKTFAQLVLDLEIKYNFCSSLKNLTALMSTYTQGIEFYNSIRSPKYHYYNEKLHGLLNSPETSQLILEMNSEKNKKYQSKDLYFDRTTELTLNNYFSEVSTLNSEIHLNLKSQLETLNKKLEERKQKRLLKNEENANEEISCLNTKKYEEEVEVIIDKYTEEKLRIKNKIDEEYQRFVKDLDDSGSEIIEKLKAELRKNMQLEYSDKLNSLEEKKNSDIGRLRDRFFSSKYRRGSN